MERVFCCAIDLSSLGRLKVNVIANMTFEGTQEMTDGKSYNGCQFTRCTIVYSGGDTSFVNCNFDTCNWIFHGAAGKTVAFMKALYHGMGQSGKLLVEQTFAEIRKP
jgi:hypothetical protein